MQLDVRNTAIQDVKTIHQFRSDDYRGSFVKTFHATALQEQGITFVLKESFYSVSVNHVIRGMHFHHPPYDHAKIIYCTHGKILDVALDLRKQSDTYGQFTTCELSFDNHTAMYIPSGFAHGFLTLSTEACTCYLVSGEYNSGADDGIRFDSFGLDWQNEFPILSERDLSFTTLEHFQSPF